MDNRVGLWSAPAVISVNNFIYKSLSNWAFNVAVGCSHACRFCYVPSAATIKQGPKLAEYGVEDPDAEWGDYVLLRPWDEDRFLASLRAANRTPASELKRDGNRAVIYCHATDPYQVIHHPNPARQKELAAHARRLVRRSLELIRDHSNLNVRILTRSPLARADFDLFRSFGPATGVRHERADPPQRSRKGLRAPRAGTVAATGDAASGARRRIARVRGHGSTYPECDETDLRATLSALAEVEPITIYHEPINIRAENVERIEAQAVELGGAFENPRVRHPASVGRITRLEPCERSKGSPRSSGWRIGCIYGQTSPSDRKASPPGYPHPPITKDGCGSAGPASASGHARTSGWAQPELSYWSRKPRRTVA